jgi:hypothetical protein
VERGGFEASWNALVVGPVLLVELEEAAHDSKKLVQLGEAGSWISHQERIQIKNSQRRLQKVSIGEVETVPQ